ASSILDLIGSTRGSVLFRGATGWSILPPGNSGLVLTSNGAGADPTYQAGGSGAMALLNTLSASNSSTLADTTSLASTYSSYLIIFQNLVPVANATELQLQLHSGGTFQVTNYNFCGSHSNNTGLAVQTTSAGTFISLSAKQAIISNTATNGGISGSITIFNPSQASSNKSLT